VESLDHKIDQVELRLLIYTQAGGFDKVADVLAAKDSLSEAEEEVAMEIVEESR